MKAKNNDEKTNSLPLFVYFCMRQMFFPPVQAGCIIIVYFAFVHLSPQDVESRSHYIK